MPRAVVLHKDDNVGTLIDSGRAGEACTLQGERSGTVTLAADVAFGHKVCIAAAAAGGDVLKYGQVIGKAARPLVVAGKEMASVFTIISSRASSAKAWRMRCGRFPSLAWKYVLTASMGLGMRSSSVSSY